MDAIAQFARSFEPSNESSTEDGDDENVAPGAPVSSTAQTEPL
jgi:hypothetical protein